MHNSFSYFTHSTKSALTSGGGGDWKPFKGKRSTFAKPTFILNIYFYDVSLKNCSILYVKQNNSGAVTPYLIYELHPLFNCILCTNLQLVVLILFFFPSVERFIHEPFGSWRLGDHSPRHLRLIKFLTYIP